MVSTSFNFLIFFPIATILNWIIPIKFRVYFLLIASYFFYINIKPVYLLLLIGISTSTWLFTNLIDKAQNDIKKKKFMIINIIIILLPLFFFKYFGIINQAILTILESNLLKWSLPEIKLILPIGISFYTFMAIGYTVDVYNEKMLCYSIIIF